MGDCDKPCGFCTSGTSLAQCDFETVKLQPANKDGLVISALPPFARRILALPDTRVSPPMFATVEQTSTKLHPPATTSAPVESSAQSLPWSPSPPPSLFADSDRRCTSAARTTPACKLMTAAALTSCCC